MNEYREKFKKNLEIGGDEFCQEFRCGTCNECHVCFWEQLNKGVMNQFGVFLDGSVLNELREEIKEV